MNTLVAEPITCATKDSPRLFWAKDVKKRRKLIQTQQLPEKVWGRQKFFPRKRQLPEKVS
jgi:hypothetical protein